MRVLEGGCMLSEALEQRRSGIMLADELLLL